MKGRRRILSAARLVGIAGLAALAWIPAQGEQAVDPDAAVSAAKEKAAHWLDALDVGGYSETWNALAVVMKEGRAEEDWIRDVAAPRAELGKPSKRRLEGAEFSTSPRGAPTGAYVTARYFSEFNSRPPALETLLLKLEGGSWRVAGYYIGPTSDTPTGTSPADKGTAGAKPEG